MSGNIELLKFIYQNSQMGIDTIGQLIDIAEGKEFKEHLETQLEEYKKINEKAKDLLNDEGCNEESISMFEKIRAYLMINFQTLTDKSPSHIAEMLIIGSNMGVLDATKNLKKYKEADKKIVDLMEKLLKIEENNIQSLKEFL